jgi:flagellar biosynthetic protein FliR
MPFQELLQQMGMQFDSNREVLLMGLILARSMPLVFLAPYLGSQMIPSEVKIGLGVALAVITYPLAREALHGPLPMAALPVLLLMLKETMVGFCIGFSTSHMFSAMEVAGRFIDTARGAAMGEVMLPSTRQRATVLGNLYQQLLVVFFVTLGGYRLFFDMYLQSFVRIPLDVGIAPTPGYAPMVAYACETSSKVLYIGVILAAPAVAATFITDLVFGILNRVAPQLNAYFLAMPVKAMGGLALVLIGLPPIVQRFELYMTEVLVAVEQTIELLTRKI